MDINVTLIIQMLVFFAVIWITMKYIWPVILGAMQEREQKITDGLAAGDRAEKELERAKAKVDTLIIEAKEQAGQIKEQANQVANKVKDQAKSDALAEKERQMASAEAEIEQQVNRAREQLRQQVSTLAVAGAEKLISKEIDAQKHAQLLDELIAEI